MVRLLAELGIEQSRAPRWKGAESETAAETAAGSGPIVLSQLAASLRAALYPFIIS
ncbi:hypothetical protein [Pseudarthrobacter oxydans]|uniref:hypothetical protein n=1 Tax=Pseudarthrobacter oxydans TaxID=1671 RepID=UPI0037F9F9DA